MNFIKRQSLGSYLGCMVLVAAAVGEVYYAINQGTATFGNIDKNLVVILLVGVQQFSLSWPY